MTDILEEVLSDHNEEKRLVFFKRLLPIVIIISIIVIIVMVINNKNKDKKIKNNQKNGDIFVKAVGIETIEGDKAFAFNTLENLINTSDTRIKEIALLEQIAIKISEKNYSEARSLLSKIIENDECYEITKAYARISWLSLIVDNKTIVNEDKEKMVKYLNYFDDEKKPFWATANIIKAIWDINNNMPTEAEKILINVLASNNVPDLVRSQAEALLANLSKSTLTPVLDKIS